MLYTLNLYSAVCQLGKSGKKEIIHIKPFLKIKK